MRENEPPGAAFPTSQFRAEAAELIGIDSDEEDVENAPTDKNTEN